MNPFVLWRLFSWEDISQLEALMQSICGMIEILIQSCNELQKDPYQKALLVQMEH